VKLASIPLDGLLPEALRPSESLSLVMLLDQAGPVLEQVSAQTQKVHEAWKTQDLALECLRVRLDNRV
jgi:hypothetical protein